MSRDPEARGGEDAVEAVRGVVASIPPGRVLSYGDVAELARLGTPRLAARIMASGKLGRGAAWWRVVRADGTLPNYLQITAREHYEREGTPLRGTRAHWVQVDVRRARWDAPPDDFPPDVLPEGGPAPGQPRAG